MVATITLFKIFPWLFPDKYQISLTKLMQNVRYGSSFWPQLTTVFSTRSLTTICFQKFFLHHWGKKSLRTLWHKCFCKPSMVLNQPGYITSIIPCSFQNVNFPWLKYYSRTFPWTWRRFPQNISWPVATLLQMQKLNHELDQRWIRGFHTLNVLAFWVQFKGKQCSVWVVEWIIRYVSQRFVRTTSQS